MKSTFGKNIRVSIWGGSHEPAIGADIEGLPIGTHINMDELRAFLARRAPGSSPLATKRKEPDLPIPVRGVSVWGGAALGNSTPDTLAKADSVIVTGPVVSFEIRNTDAHSSDYKQLRTIPRPGHADYTARLRYGDELNMAGGGPFSARMTAPLCIAGGIALQILQREGISIGAHLYSVAGINDAPLDPLDVTSTTLEALRRMEFPVLSDEAAEKMSAAILQAKEELDSVGGIVEVCAAGLPGGIGGAMYDGLESCLAPIFFGIPAVKGLEFGSGFHAAELKGSENNDPFYYDDSGNVKTRTNHHGGILGGITTGMPLVARIAFKPTPSIGREQDSIDMQTHKPAKLIITGRHDPCVALRAVPITEAALALGILDCIMEVSK